MEFVSDYELKGLQNHYHTYGLGVPLIAVRKNHPTQNPIERYYPKGLSFPVTAFLRIVPHQDGSPTHHVALLEFYDPLNATDLAINGRRVPLETDLSTALAYALNQPELRDLDQPTTGLIHPEATEQAQGLYMLEPYQPGKIPVLMVHGVWSSPITWMEMFNDLRSSPEVRDRFQFWFYLYPTAQPFWFSAAQLRSDLAQMRQTIDPYRQELALDQMVLVGHSMGGLVGNMQTVDSGDDYWRIVSREAFDNVKASPDIKQTLAQTLFFRANPSIRQVIFIGTPHRGSAFANETLRWLSNRFINLPKLFVNGSRELHNDNPAFFNKNNLIDVTTSIDSLAPDCPIFPVILQSKHPPSVRYHNINGRIPDTMFAQRLGGRRGRHPGECSFRQRRFRDRCERGALDTASSSAERVGGAANSAGTRRQPASRARWPAANGSLDGRSTRAPRRTAITAGAPASATATAGTTPRASVRSRQPRDRPLFKRAEPPAINSQRFELWQKMRRPCGCNPGTSASSRR